MSAPETTPDAPAPGGVGVLRLLFAGLVLACVALAPFAGGEAHGWRTVAVYVAPVLAVLIFWLLLFDLLMARVLMSDHRGPAREGFRRVLRFDGVLLALLTLAWTPFFVRLTLA